MANAVIMQKANTYIFLLLKNIVILSVIASLVVWIAGEDSSFGSICSGIAFYGTLAGIYLFIIHVALSVLSFILKHISKIRKYVYLLLKNTVIVSVISTVVAWVAGEDSSFGSICSGIAVYGTLVSIYLFFIHIVALLLSLIVQDNPNNQH